MLPVMRRVALTVSPVDAATNPHQAQRLLRDARFLGDLAHPHLVSVIDVGLYGGRSFLATEYLEGETLAARLQRSGPMPPHEAIAVMLPLCSALHAAHQRGGARVALELRSVMLARQVTGHITPKVLRFAEALEGSAATQHAAAAPAAAGPDGVAALQRRGAVGSLAAMLWEMLSGAAPREAVHMASDAPLARAVARALEADRRGDLEAVDQFARTLLAWADAPTVERWADAFGDDLSGTLRDAPMAGRTAVADNEGAPLERTLATHGAQGAWAPGASFAPSDPALATSSARRRGLWGRRIALGVSACIAVLVGAVRLLPSLAAARAQERPEGFLVALRTEPVNARIDLDGHFVAAGLLLRELARDHRPHALRVYAEGFVPRTVTFADESPGDLIALELLPVTADAAPGDAGGSAESGARGSARPGTVTCGPARRPLRQALRSQQVSTP